MAKKFFITNSIPYVNAAPHIGHALEFVQTDTIARYHKLVGDQTLVLCGSDENALKNVQAAQKANQPVQEFVDQNAEIFQEFAKKLDVQFDIFQKGSDQQHHFPSSQKLWELCEKNGDIYKKNYEGLYCVGCETFYTKDELDEKGECFEHPGRKLDVVSELNYFFKLSKYQGKLIELITNDQLKIYPTTRKNEVLAFLKEPLLDISISRSNERAKNWGVPVPGDNTQRIYVWFDALNIYQSGIGFGWGEKKYKTWWPADVHVIGKGILKFHAIYWPAFLLSAKLPTPKSLFTHGYITVNGQKMSKTLGNVIDPFELLKKYPVDALRYYFLHEIPTFGDGDYSENRMIDIYNSDLANELGNLVLRITTIAQQDDISVKLNNSFHYDQKTIELFESFQFNIILTNIWKKIKELNKKIDDFAPWKKKIEERKDFLISALSEITEVGNSLEPFMPNTAEKIIQATSGKIKKIAPLFPRI